MSTIIDSYYAAVNEIGNSDEKLVIFIKGVNDIMAELSHMPFVPQTFVQWPPMAPVQAQAPAQAAPSPALAPIQLQLHRREGVKCCLRCGCALRQGISDAREVSQAICRMIAQTPQYPQEYTWQSGDMLCRACFTAIMR